MKGVYAYMMIGDRIKQLRIDAKMTQPELAKRLDVTRSAVATYENNSRQPSFQILIRLAKIFNVSTDYLLLGNDNNLLDVEGLSGERGCYGQREAGSHLHALPAFVP